jgi:hypothetical protein
MSTKDKKILKHNQELLDLCFKRDGATLKSPQKGLTRNSIIPFVCKCGKDANPKRFENINKTGAYCRECLKVNTQKKFKATNLERLGVEYPTQSNKVMDKQKVTNLVRYGVEHPLQSEQIRENKTNTTIERYGVEHHTHLQEILDKNIATNIKRYGVEHPAQNKEIYNKIVETNLQRYDTKCSLQNEEVKKKKDETVLKKYGVKMCLQNEDVKAKSVATSLEKYGVRNPMQSTEIQEKNQKNSLKFKEFKCPSGSIRKVQGDEPYALDELMKEYTEDQVKTDRKDIPRILYMYNEEEHYYFCDIFIPHINKLIEVKSTWTFSLHNDKIIAKGKECIEKGYLYEIWIYDDKKHKTIFIPS